MTKKILLKWLAARKAEALAQVDTQETAAKAALLAEKLERTKFAEMVAYVEPRLTEVYNYMMDWHKKNEELAGPLSMLQAGLLHFNKTCVNTKAEFGAYAWDEKASSDAVIKENDHSMDQMRYFVRTIMKREVRAYGIK